MHKLIQFSLRNKTAVLIFTFLMAVGGSIALYNLPIGAVPDITNNQVQVITTARHLSTEDMERYVTYPVELELMNLPGVQEIRSVSKFGLSVITVVFDESMGNYIPRQLLSERLQSIRDQIPEGVSPPFLGPITTGLGEVYQYTLEVKKGYEERYSLTELRTIHDWVVRRQMAGIEGVVEVNSWGGKLKQVSIELKQDALQTYGITLVEVWKALESANAIQGGAYIEKHNQSRFIRSDGRFSELSDIEQVAVGWSDDLPISLADVAEVRYGSAPRFGAVSSNGRGEAVIGQIMMLKGANSYKVIQEVKNRVEEVQNNLPEGLEIVPFADRSELIGRTTATVRNNLIEGCLVVIAVVFLLLGNLRSGLVIASVIPLSLLFAFIMMRLFGVDANLMSLGAIDFGIIIDGSIIIVDMVAVMLVQQAGGIQSLPKNEQQGAIDKVTLEGSATMMRSAIYGQLMVLIVFIPILILSGVEGKMFRPMALTFSFALIGAMILFITYVPVVSSMVLKPNNAKGNRFSAGLITFLEGAYRKVAKHVMQRGSLALVMALFLLTAGMLTYQKLGGEFVPTLDEGDMVIQPILPAGTSLSETIRMTTRIEQELLSHFPEVSSVVSRIGAAEVPTDPMSMEEPDVMIKLKEPNEWTSAETKEELEAKIKAHLQSTVGVEMEFTQPIEMRFNELITGVRADIAVTVFGEDLNTLLQYGSEIEEIIKPIDGVGDVTAEKLDPIPLLSIEPDRAALAKYGLSLDDMNPYIGLLVAGLPVGEIFEGERRFNIVLRLEGGADFDLDQIRNLNVELGEGRGLRLGELARVELRGTPAMIARSNTKRRIVVGVNVRNRDLESVVQDIQQRINESIKFAPGYHVEYGGQFKNLLAATKRLSIAVPIVLLMIFVALRTAFKSTRKAVLVFTAVPFAATGGIFMLFLRGLPFSISAGVGFIALFGVAVLNGIVLIEHLKALKALPGESERQRILRGTKERLRPVLLTASAAAFGFLPMAISTTAGAEVQRPLASVVIGGLVTATFLTLFLLPVLYERFISDKPSVNLKSTKALSILLLLFVLPLSRLEAQTDTLNLTMALERIRISHPAVQAAQQRTSAEEARMPVRIRAEMPEIYHSFDEINQGENGVPLDVFGISQTFQVPGSQSGARELAKADIESARVMGDYTLRAVQARATQSYVNIRLVQERMQFSERMLAFHAKVLKGAEVSLSAGGMDAGDVLRSRQARLQEELRFEKLKVMRVARMQELASMLGSENQWVIEDNSPLRLPLPEKPDPSMTPDRRLAELQVLRTEAQTLHLKRQRLPDVSLEVFEGNNTAPGAIRYAGYRVGLRIPLWFEQSSREIKGARMDAEAARSEALAILRESEASIASSWKLAMEYLAMLQRYEKELLPTAEEVIRISDEQMSRGEADLFKVLADVLIANEHYQDYFDLLEAYNTEVIYLTYLLKP